MMGFAKRLGIRFCDWLFLTPQQRRFVRCMDAMHKIKDAERPVKERVKDLRELAEYAMAIADNLEVSNE